MSCPCWTLSIHEHTNINAIVAWQFLLLSLAELFFDLGRLQCVVHFVSFGMSARSLKVYIRENIEHTDGMGDTTKRTMLSWAYIVCFAACLSGVAAQGSVQVNTVEIRLSVGFEVGGGARDLVDAELVLVRTFLAAQVQSACTTATATCVVG